MALKYSTGARAFRQLHGSLFQAIQGGIIDIWSSGTVPTSADDAATGTLLCRITLGGGAFTAEVLSAGTVTLSGADGQVDNITVNGVDILGAVVAYDTDLATTAENVAREINRTLSSPRYKATSSGAVITITALPGTGTQPNGYAVVTTVSGGTLAKADVNMGTAVAGVAGGNGLTWDAVGAVLSKLGTFSGSILATGQATYFRVKGSVTDSDAASTTLIRIQGTCGLTAADYIMTGTTTLTMDGTHTWGDFDITEDETASA